MTKTPFSDETPSRRTRFLPGVVFFSSRLHRIGRAILPTPNVRSASLLAWVKSAIAFREMAFRARSTFEKNREIREHSSPRTRVGASALWKAHRSSFTCAMSDGTLTERERLVYSAKLAEQAERYDGASGPGRCFILRDWLPRAARDRGWVPACRECPEDTHATARRP